jgi:hypothetical protein
MVLNHPMREVVTDNTVALTRCVLETLTLQQADVPMRVVQQVGTLV